MLPQLTEAAVELENCGFGGRLAVADRFAAMLGMSTATLFRKLRKEGLYDSGRKKRADAGTIKVGVSEEQIRQIMALMLTSKRNTGTIEMAAGDAIQIAEANGLIGRGVLSESVLNSHLRRMQADKRSLLAATPHINMRSLHPNHVHQVDPSVCLQWDIDDRGMDERDMVREFYKNKPDNMARMVGKRTKKLMRYVLTDHNSGNIEIFYYFIAGESATAMVDFLIHCWLEKNNGNPFHGVPKILLWDQGSANKSHPVMSLLDALDVDVLTHLPGNPRGKGQVECANRIVQRSFESRLRISPPANLDDLNKKAAEWCRWYNASKVHSRHGMSRSGLWQTIKADQLRILRASPEEIRHLAVLKPETRKIGGDYTITITSKGTRCTYRLADIPGMAPRLTVQVRRNAFTPDTIQVRLHDDEAWIEVRPVEYMAGIHGGSEMDAPVIGERYTANPDTASMQHEAAMQKATYGTETARDANNARKRREKPFAGVDAMAPFSAEQFTAPSYMKRRGTDLPIAAAPEIAPLAGFELIKTLRRKLGRPLYPEENTAIRAEYPDGMNEDQISAWLQGPTHDKPALRAVS